MGRSIQVVNCGDSHGPLGGGGQGATQECLGRTLLFPSQDVVLLTLGLSSETG